MCGISTMANEGTCTWIGGSGKAYSYHVYALPVTITFDKAGNYIFAKIVDGKWVPTCIGEGDIDRDANDGRQLAAWISRGVTHLHIRLNPSDSARISERDDLLAGNPSAYSYRGQSGRPGPNSPTRGEST